MNKLHTNDINRLIIYLLGTNKNYTRTVSLTIKHDAILPPLSKRKNYLFYPESVWSFCKNHEDLNKAIEDRKIDSLEELLEESFNCFTSASKKVSLGMKILKDIFKNYIIEMIV